MPKIIEDCMNNWLREIGRWNESRRFRSGKEYESVQRDQKNEQRSERSKWNQDATVT